MPPSCEIRPWHQQHPSLRRLGHARAHVIIPRPAPPPRYSGSTYPGSASSILQYAIVRRSPSRSGVLACRPSRSRARAVGPPLHRVAGLGPVHDALTRAGQLDHQAGGAW